ncbi:MAG TPA: FkbM family methyltransferase [Terriglobales bacterium]|nr:FkbM family methyltransferase [Terriglobales bacterium]
MEALVGRPNLVRLARAMTMMARRDVANEMGSNGELLVQQIVLRHLKEQVLVAFDVGANAGEWSKALLANANDKVFVHGFEPASATFELLTQNLKSSQSQVRLVKQALSAQPGTAELFIVGDGFGINSLHARQGRSHRSEIVVLNTVDQYCRESEIEHIEIMKIDAEGHDFLVMEGAKRMLFAKAISVLQFEYNHRWIDSRHLLKDVFDLLCPVGYCLGKVTPRGIEFYNAYHFELESFREGNYLACLPEWKERFPQVKWWYEG